MSRRNRERRRQEIEEAQEPDLTPIMNLSFMLILALLSTAASVSLGWLTVEVPKLSSGGASIATDKPKENALNLTIIINPDGFNIGASGAILDGNSEGRAGESLLLKTSEQAEAYNYDALEQRLLTIKEKFAAENTVIIVADSDIPFGVVVKTMDAARGKPGKWLFPGVSFSPGMVNR